MKVDTGLLARFAFRAYGVLTMGAGPQDKVWDPVMVDGQLGLLISRTSGLQVHGLEANSHAAAFEYFGPGAVKEAHLAPVDLRSDWEPQSHAARKWLDLHTKHG